MEDVFIAFTTTWEYGHYTLLHAGGPVVMLPTGWLAARLKNKRRQLRGLLIGLVMWVLAIPTNCFVLFVVADSYEASNNATLLNTGAAVTILLFMFFTAALAVRCTTPRDETAGTWRQFGRYY